MKKLLMVILDGFGLRDEEHGNAIEKAKVDYFNRLWNEYPHSVLAASEEAVGLPTGIFGNSEVCHQVIGLGKKIKQRLTLVHEEIMNKNIMKNERFISLVDHVKQNESTLHLMGLVSPGGVHSHINYIKGIIPILKEMGVKRLVFHAITDGRDTNAKSSNRYLEELNQILVKNELGFIGTVCGRYYAMDRDNHYDRTKIYYNLVTSGNGLNVLDVGLAIHNCYLKGITDEFLPPLLLNPEGRINEHDALLWLNYRTDRSRQIINALSDPEFNQFLPKVINNFKVYTMFPELEIPEAESLFNEHNEDLYPLGEYLADLDFTQARIAESEKYSHVTKFFNSEKTLKYKNNDNFIIDSPKVATFENTPLMSAAEVAKQTMKCLEKDYDFILVNFCNPDMVGHTGNMAAVIAALEALDVILAEVINCAEDNFYKVIITSDHGNADYMLNEQNIPITSHSLSPVPFILMDKHVILKEQGDLTMIAPTILEYLDIAIPKEMRETKSLIINDD